MITKITVAAILLVCLPLHAEEEKVNPIDIKMNADMEENPSTGGMVGAASTALEAWQKDIASSLIQLKKAMSKEELHALEISQKAWEVFVKAELTTQSELYSKMEGTMWRPIAVLSSMELYKERALKLRRYLETIAAR